MIFADPVNFAAVTFGGAACMQGCPVNVKIPQFIARVREQDFKGAYHKILEDSSLPAICGRVCPQEKQCESKCVRGIKGEPVGIGRLERFVADWNRENADEMPEKIATEPTAASTSPPCHQSRASAAAPVNIA